jgi:hypothetical protein
MGTICSVLGRGIPCRILSHSSYVILNAKRNLFGTAAVATK